MYCDMSGPDTPDDDEPGADAASTGDDDLGSLPPWGGGCEDGCC
jgi:hypothetical protein